jgi:hypothetical protein
MMSEDAKIDAAVQSGKPQSCLVMGLALSEMIEMRPPAMGLAHDGNECIREERGATAAPREAAPGFVPSRKQPA